ncbi:MAG: hypothetical protein IPM39_13005 [Chloroflexi bacterium]|nr:hypothetical protein [Chloroflexota bacterium]
MDPTDIGAVEVEVDATIEAGADLTIKLIKATSLWDFGDLPDGYGTLLASNGARHRTTTGLRLGASVDAEGNGFPTADATGDNTNFAFGTTNDEDGVVRQPGVGGAGAGGNGGWTNGTVASGNGGRLDLTITGGSGVPQVFIDFGDGNGNLSGTLTPVTLRNSSGTALGTTFAAGTHQVYFDIPDLSFAVDGQPMAVRVRLSSAGGLGSTGPALDGEVEDYIYSFGPTAVSLQSFTPAASSTLPVIAFIGFLGLAIVSLGAFIVRRERSRL